MRISNPHSVVCLAFVLLFSALVFSQTKPEDKAGVESSEKIGAAKDKPKKKIVKTDVEWRKQLSRMQYKVTRQGHTEPPRTGHYYRHKEKGNYLCICCDEPLFSWKTKFNSGTGWPSFYAPLDKKQIATKIDRSVPSLGVRLEVLCSRCDAHLGHVFSDGPRPTGLRYCLNASALKFEGEKEKKKAKEKEAAVTEEEADEKQASKD